MQTYLNEMKYGNCDITQWNGNGRNSYPQLNGFWLESSLLISPMEQVKVLYQAFETDMFHEKRKNIVKELMKVEEEDIPLYGKTGTGYNEAGDCVDGWFVGWLQAKDPVYFAIRLQDTKAEDSTGNKAKEIAISIIKNR